MVTKEHSRETMCLFYASEYHLEMILLPYIKDRINDSKIVIFTESNLEKSLQIVLERTNLKDSDKEKIKNLNWNADDYNKYKELEKRENKFTIIINGRKDYIENIDNNIKKQMNKSIKVIHCYHIGDPNISIAEICTKYKEILNTRKLK